MKRVSIIKTILSAATALALPACSGIMLGVDDDYGIGSGYYDDYYFPSSPSLFAPLPPPPRYYYPGFNVPAWSYPRPLPPGRPGASEPSRPPSDNRPSRPEQTPPAPSTPGVRPGANGSFTRPSSGTGSVSNSSGTLRRPAGGASGRH